MDNSIEMDDLGVITSILGNPHTANHARFCHLRIEHQHIWFDVSINPNYDGRSGGKLTCIYMYHIHMI